MITPEPIPPDKDFHPLAEGSGGPAEAVASVEKPSSPLDKVSSLAPKGVVAMFMEEPKDATKASPRDFCICGCAGDACIPQREYDRPQADPLPQDDLQEMISFSVNGKCGYPLDDALKKRYTGLDGRDDRVFVGSKSSISMRLEWLPYGKWSRQIRTLTWRKLPDYICRAKLATEVAKRMKLFFHEMEGKDADPSYRQYRVQPGVVDINHLELVALKRVAKSSYMPHFRLISPAKSP